MDAATVKVLLVGESKAGYSSIIRHLEKRGCQCQFTNSCSQGACLIADSSFDLVLCGSQMDGSQDLISAVIDSHATLFRYVLVEDGCWWVPAVLQGKYSSDAPALRPRQFTGVLDSIAKGTKENRKLRAGFQAMAHFAG